MHLHGFFLLSATQGLAVIARVYDILQDKKGGGRKGSFEVARAWLGLVFPAASSLDDRSQLLHLCKFPALWDTGEGSTCSQRPEIIATLMPRAQCSPMPASWLLGKGAISAVLPTRC